eukprot:1773100-Lingulodinium_polyedra.AAC.1
MTQWPCSTNPPENATDALADFNDVLIPIDHGRVDLDAVNRVLPSRVAKRELNKSRPRVLCLAMCDPQLCQEF